MEENYQDSYFIINTALYSAESYIYKNYNINTRATLVHEYFGDVTGDNLHSRFNIQNLLAIYTADGYVLPSIVYYNPSTQVYEIADGPFRLEDSTLIEASATNLNIEYVTGYIYPTNVKDTATIPSGNSDWGSDVTMPRICNPDSSPLYSPLSTTSTYYDLYIIADEGASIYVNNTIGELRDAKGVLITDAINPRQIVNENRIARVTLSLVAGVNTFVIDARDAVNNKSEAITIIINKQANFSNTTVSLYTKDLVTNDGKYNIVLQSTPGSIVTVNGVAAVQYSNGIDVVELVQATEGLFDVNITVTSPAGTISRPLHTKVLYDSTLSDSYVESVNDMGNNSITMPQDMLMALLMIANHYFRIALYKHEDTQSYGDNVSNRTTFIADRFPKEAHRILSNYTRY